ncbi:MAG: DNA/RNA nuclease SfsA [Proteobacteria bacterium]|nr:DNA/RNA nuclease SfsA [Pseudomonadota bacterium]MBK8957582.1 DNA/RNA nuclease SfsA [Pseudomonadota bacterium]
MKFARPLIAATLLRRYQRFLADCELDDGTRLTAACPNTGSMLGCCTPGNRVWLSESDAPTRKYRHTWEMVQVGKLKIGINTGLPNRLVREAVENGVLAELGGYERVRGEVPFGVERSRIDLLLQSERRPDCYVEVKNVTAAVSDGIALFPDAVSARGAKHLRELMRLKAEGLRAVLVYCVQRGDVEEVRPADGIDPLYGRTLREALAAGVEVLAYRARVTTEEVILHQRIAVHCPPL